jgi:hypothetical protein
LLHKGKAKLFQVFQTLPCLEENATENEINVFILYVKASPNFAYIIFPCGKNTAKLELMITGICLLYRLFNYLKGQSNKKCVSAYQVKIRNKA